MNLDQIARETAEKIDKHIMEHGGGLSAYEFRTMIELHVLDALKRALNTTASVH